VPKKEAAQSAMLQLFNKEKCLTIENLSQSLNYSFISVRRFLRETGYHSSFTHNSKWYTLATIPNFNKQGIWFYEDVGFSKHGNLIQTIRHFINNSPYGLTAKELFQFLFVPCHPMLSLMHKKGHIDRFNTQRGFIYLSNNETEKQKQLNRLQARLIEIKENLQLHPQAALYVLIEFIKKPKISFETLSKTVEKKRGMNAAPEAIAQFFETYDLKKILR